MNDDWRPDPNGQRSAAHWCLDRSFAWYWKKRETDEAWTNGVHRVIVAPLGVDPDGAVYRLLIVERLDGEPIRLRHELHAIKDHFAGLQAEAVELFPSASRSVDFGASTWLWAVTGKRFAIGFDLTFMTLPVDMSWMEDDVRNRKRLDEARSAVNGDCCERDSQAVTDDRTA